ncbi:hypothetical protein RUM43_004682 [Polyplax serrata]|uniref:Serine hydroxymethyltransferase n=1 Tax=Polyplax serrata TaxID=468196 RepID=A0AAN8XLV1_POLSC
MLSCRVAASPFCLVTVKTFLRKMALNGFCQSALSKDLQQTDPELYDLIKEEKNRQKCSIELIASENFTSVPVLQCLSSCLTNKYSEGLPGQRYYGGNTYIDEIERLCQKRALEAFDLNPEEWGVNVQPYSGSPANFAVYTALIEPNGRIMGLDLPDGGHLTHGFMTAKKKISATSIFFQSMPYKVHPETGLVDYEKLAESARLFKPQIIIAGMSCYARCFDYKKFRDICDENNCYLFSDMAHISGLVAAKLIPSPFEYSDVVTTTTHKTLRGPRAGMIFYRKGVKTFGRSATPILYDLESKINQAVFPGLQGGPHNNAIAGIATALQQVKSPEFVKYQKQVLLNAKHMCTELEKLGYTVATGGTDVHLVLLDLRSTGLKGSVAEHVLEEINIACNKNTVPGDKSALNPSGIRLGTPAVTTRGLVEKDIEKVVAFIHRGLNIAKRVQEVSGPKFSDFKETIKREEKFIREISDLKKEVEKFAGFFPLPGLDL